MNTNRNVMCFEIKYIELPSCLPIMTLTRAVILPVHYNLDLNLWLAPIITPTWTVILSTHHDPNTSCDLACLLWPNMSCQLANPSYLSLSSELACPITILIWITSLPIYHDPNTSGDLAYLLRSWISSRVWCKAKDKIPNILVSPQAVVMDANRWGYY